MAKKAGVKTAQWHAPDAKIMWRRHDGTHVRVWRDGWPGDNFLIVTKSDFDCFCSIARYLGLHAIEEAKD